MMIKAKMIKAKQGRMAHELTEKGAAAVEFAIVISLLVLITGGIVEFGRVLWYLDALAKATRDGARLMSDAANTQLGSNVGTAQNLVINAATAAGLAPALTNGNISVQCDYGAGWVNCTNAASETAPGPLYVTVSITGFSVAFGSWFAIPLPRGDWALGPHTTMRYMR